MSDLFSQYTLKELSFCNELKLYNPFIFAIFDFLNLDIKHNA